MNRRRRFTKRQFIVPMAAAALVLAIAMGSAAVWVLFASPAPDALTNSDTPWWPGLGAVPTR